MDNLKINNHGFTIIELMVTLSISMLVMSGVFNLYNSQQEIYNEQDEIANMQQSAQLALDIMTREIRMAGFDPTENGFVKLGDGSGGNILGNTLQFNVDWNRDGLLNGTDESITYSLNGAQLIRTTNTTPAQGEVLIEDVTNLAFTYYLASDTTGVDDTAGVITYGIADDDDCDGTIDEAGELLALPDITGCNPGLNNTYPSPANNESLFIRGIQINITVRTENPDSDYTNPDGINGQYRTTQLVTRIRPRNLGL